MHLSPAAASNWVRKERKKISRLSAEIIGGKRPGSPGLEAASQSLPSSQPIDASIQHHGGEDISEIPQPLLVGTEMTKVRSREEKRRTYRLDPDEGRIVFLKHGKEGAIAIETIKEIRSGADAHYYRALFKYPEDAEKRWITIIYILDSEYKTLHLIADTEEILKMWDTSLRKLFAIRQGLINGFGDVGTRQSIWERQYWKSADKGGDQKLSFSEVKWLCWRLNANLESQNVAALFEEFDSGKKGYLEFSEFQKFVKKLRRRPEVEELYGRICSENGGRLDFNAFVNFMQKSQGSVLSNEELGSVFAKYAVSSTEAGGPSTFDLDALSAFLISFDNTSFSQKDRTCWQDMNRPIAEYYVSASHNTYLIGHQLLGVSTIEGYIRALLLGCRSVELDIYDGKEEPVVFHGKTFTSAVSVRDICTAIARYGFTTSPYPIIVSAEIHCSLEQQDKLVDIMAEVFGDKLVKAPVEGRPKLEKLPSPESLKGMVLLKAKNLYVVAQLEAIRMQKAVEKQAVLDAETSSSSSEDGLEDSIKAKLKDKWRSVRGKPTTSSLEEKQSSMNKTLMSLSLASLLVYTVGIKCHGFDGTINYEPEYMFSLSESQANRMIAKGGSKKESQISDGSADGMRKLIRHTRNCLVRIYPKGLRFDSSNYEPNRFWAAGAQVVAVNWQTFDIGYMMTTSMFLRNGKAGYVLKPLALRDPEEKLLETKTNHVLEVTIISAQQLPRLKNSIGQEIVEKSLVDPFVRVTLHIPDWNHSPLPTETTISTEAGQVSKESSSLPTSGASAKNAHTAVRAVSAQTKIIKNNGFNPVWQETLTLPFDCVGGQEMQDLIFVEFRVIQEGYDDDDKPIASYFTPLSCLQTGFRHLPLHDTQLMPYLFSTLFIESNVRDQNTTSS